MSLHDERTIGRTALEIADALLDKSTHSWSLLAAIGLIRAQLAEIERLSVALEQIADAAQSVRAAGLKAGLKPGTINRRLAVLRRVANLAHNEWGWRRNAGTTNRRAERRHA